MGLLDSLGKGRVVPAVVAALHVDHVDVDAARGEERPDPRRKSMSAVFHMTIYKHRR